MKEIIGALSKALNVAESELTSALMDGEGKVKDGAAKFITDKFADHIKGINDAAEEKRKTDLENIKGKTVKETAEKFEKAIRDNLPGIDQALKGDDLLKVIPESISKIRTAQTEPDKIKTSETYITGLRETEEKLKQEYEGKIKTKDEEFLTLKSKVENDKVKTAILEKAREYHATLNLRDDIPATAIQHLIKTAEDGLVNGNKFKVLENGDIILVDDKGEMLKDQHGHSVKLTAKIEEAFKPVLDLTVAGKPRKPNGKGDGDEGGTGGGASEKLTALGLSLPKNAADYENLMPKLVRAQTEGKLTSDEIAKISNEARESVQKAIEESAKK